VDDHLKMSHVGREARDVRFVWARFDEALTCEGGDGSVQPLRNE